jgi:hypothetical protein
MTALVAAQSVTGWALIPLQAIVHRLFSPHLEESPTGSLSPRTLGTLLLATSALAGVPVQPAHYEDFFRWRAENLRGYKTLYEQFAAALDRRARQSVGCGFAECSQPMQQQILARLPQVRSATTRWAKVRVAVLEREWLLFDRYIVRNILLLFYKTDAWTLLGYEAWPGTPRGLDRYTQAPSQGLQVLPGR